MLVNYLKEWNEFKSKQAFQKSFTLSVGQVDAGSLVLLPPGWVAAWTPATSTDGCSGAQVPFLHATAGVDAAKKQLEALLSAMGNTAFDAGWLPAVIAEVSG